MVVKDLSSKDTVVFPHGTFKVLYVRPLKSKEGRCLVGLRNSVDIECDLEAEVKCVGIRKYTLKTLKGSFPVAGLVSLY